MRTRTVTIQEGELLGPIDWGFDWEKFSQDRGGGMNPKWLASRWEQLKTIRVGDMITSYGGMPRIGWHEVIAIGMYDGWPFMAPTPSVEVRTDFGCEWTWFGGIVDVIHKEQQCPE